MEKVFEAINRFCYESLNYEVVRFVGNYVGAVYVPKFLVEVKWSCDTEHLVRKWLGYAQSSNMTEAMFIKFYVNLDKNNQDKMAEWIFKYGTRG